MNQNASLNMHELIATARREKTFAQLIERVPYARLIGMKGMSLGDELLFILPARRIHGECGNLPCAGHH